jgi:hypothetical protein
MGAGRDSVCSSVLSVCEYMYRRFEVNRPQFTRPRLFNMYSAPKRLFLAIVRLPIALRVFTVASVNDTMNVLTLRAAASKHATFLSL